MDVCKKENKEYSINCLQERIKKHLSRIKLAILGITAISLISISGLSYTFYQRLNSSVIHALEEHLDRSSLKSIQTLKSNVQSILGSFKLQYKRGTWKASLEEKSHEFAYLFRHFYDNHRDFYNFLDQVFATTFNSEDNLIIIFNQNNIQYIYPKDINIAKSSLKNFIHMCRDKFSTFLRYKFKTRSGQIFEVNGYIIYLEDLDSYLFYGQQTYKIFNRIRNRAISAITLFNLNLNKDYYVLSYDLINNKIIDDATYYTLPMQLKEKINFLLLQTTNTNKIIHYKNYILQTDLDKFFHLKYIIIKNITPDKSLIKKPIDKISKQLITISLLANLSTIIGIIIIVIIIFMYVKKVLLELSKINTSLISDLQQQKIFLASVSHEIRTPLNGIIGFLELLNASNLNPKEKEYVKHCLSASNQLLDMVNEILDTLKAHGKQLTLSKKEFDLDKTIQEVITSLSSRVRPGVKLNYSLPDLPYYVIGDEKRIRQCFYNLISNALKFTLRGSVTVKNIQIEDVDHQIKDTLNFYQNELSTMGLRPLEPPKIKNNKSTENQKKALINQRFLKFTFIIKDTGIGIDPKTQKKLFQPFVQAENEVHQEVAGTGLGLFLCRNLAQLMGGDVWFESTPGKGTTFFLSFVLQKGKPKIKDKPTSKGSEILDYSNLKILVADDVKTNQLVISNILQKMFKIKQIDIAQNGQEAVNLALKNEYDLILMDIKMPKMNGIEAVQRIRHAGIKVPIYILTADVLKDTQEEAVRAGATGFLEKPINIDKLKYVLKNL